MKKSLFYAVLLVAPLFAACSSDDGNIQGNADRAEIRLGAQIAQAITRSAEDATQGTYIAANVLVYVYADKVSDGSAYFNAWELTADNQRNLNPAANDVRYYPGGTEGIDLYAIHGNNLGISSGQAFPSSVTHNILSDQKITSTSITGYTQSDLLYGIVRDQHFTTSKVNMNFYHMLSKVEIVMKPGPGVTAADLEGAEVQLMNVKPTVTFSPAKLTLEQLGVQANRAAMISVGGSPINVTFTPKYVDKAVSDFGDDPTYAEVILPPQAFDNVDFLQLTFKTGGLAGKSLRYKLSTTFASGYCYRFQILITPAVFSLSPISVTPWTAEESNRVIDLEKATN